jgi:hypothetical protein
MEVNLSERFAGMTPFNIRREKAREVFLLIRRLSRMSEIKEKDINPVTGKRIKRVKAGDNWF